MADYFRIEIDLGRAPTVLAALRAQEGVKIGLRTAAIYLKGKASIYPAQRHISRREAYGTAFFSDIQRRAFFAMLSSGDISVPYRRRGAGGLAGKWSVREERGGFVQMIANNAGYARLVVDEKRQSRMMAKIGWRTIQEVVRAEDPAIQKIIRDSILRSLK